MLVDSQPAGGAWNMLVDETLLHTAVTLGVCSVRLYRWDQPTLSLGYFQRGEQTGLPQHLSQLPRVRRLSGGGAIVHDCELTYSCGLPAGHPLSRSPRLAYTVVHERIASLLAEFGFVVRLRGNLDSAPSDQFLCFGRRDPFDVVADGHKILGSAQRRRKGAVLQHGSLILRRSTFAPQFPGLLDLAGRKDEPADLTERLARAIGGCLAREIVAAELSAEELRFAAERGRGGAALRAS